MPDVIDQMLDQYEVTGTSREYAPDGQYDAQGQFWEFVNGNWVRNPRFDDPTQAAGYQAPQRVSPTEAGNLSARWAELELADRRLGEEIRSNSVAEALARQSQAWLQEKETWALRNDDKRIANEAQAQLFNARSTVATLQMRGSELQAARAEVQAQLQAQTDQFNATMGFNVDQANEQAARAKREDLAQNARDIASFSASPTDWGKLAAFQLANRGWGQEDAAIQDEGGFITDRSLEPLDKALGVKEEIEAQPDRPFSWTPVQAPKLPEMPGVDLSFLMEGLQQTGSPGPIVQQGKNGWTVNDQGTADKADDKWVGPAVDWDKARRMEDGGVTSGAFVAGDSSDGKQNREVVIPDFPIAGMTTVVPEDELTPEMRTRLSKLPKAQNGGVFDNTSRAGVFQANAAKQARVGTPWATGPLPGATFASSPGLPPEVADLIASLRGVELGENPSYFQWRTNRLRPAGVVESVVGRTR